MAQSGKRRARSKKPLIDTLPGLLVNAIAQNRDFILTFETDEETGKKKIHVLTGQFITPCMLRKLIGQAMSQKEEGSTLLSRAWA